MNKQNPADLDQQGFSIITLNPLQTRDSL